MNRFYRVSLAFALAGALLFLLGLSARLGTRAVAAAPRTLFVAPDGTGTACTQVAPCALATALGLATDSDTVYLAGGTYTGTGAAVVTLTRSITLAGGWDGAPTGPVVRDPALHPTVLDGEWARRVISITGDVTPTIDGFIIARGNGTGLLAGCPIIGGKPDGCGGGIFASGAHPIIVNNIITNNVAALTTQGYPTGTTGYGGGIYLGFADRAVISGNIVISNAGSLANAGSGGGIQIDGGNNVLVHANRVLSNTATTGTGAGWGGGIAATFGSGSVEDNEITGNQARSIGGGSGGGLYQWFGSTAFRRNRVTGNYGGEAVYLGFSEALFEGNQVVGNATDTGVYIIYKPGPVLINNIVAGTLYGVQVAGTALTATLLHNTLVGSGSGWGVRVASNDVTLTLTNNIVVSYRVGISTTAPGASISADHTLFWNNADDGIRGTNAVDGDPRFFNPAADDYRLAPGSAAIDAGVDAGISEDFEGELRPRGPAPDIGADEFGLWTIYLPIVTRE